MEVSNLASGLIGSLIGAVLGSAGAYIGQRYLGDRELLRRRGGLLRAMLGELKGNIIYLYGALEVGATFGSLSENVWRAARFDLAQFVPQSTYSRLVFSTTDLGRVEELAGQIARGRANDLAIAVVEMYALNLYDAHEELRRSEYAASMRDWSLTGLTRQSIEQAALGAQERNQTAPHANKGDT